MSSRRPHNFDATDILQPIEHSFFAQPRSGRCDQVLAAARADGFATVAERAPLGTVYNAGPLKPISIRALVETVARVMGIPFDQLCEVTADRLGQDSRYWLDSSAIKRDVGWEPQIALEEGIREMVEWGRRYLDQLREWPVDYTLRG